MTAALQLSDSLAALPRDDAFARQVLSDAWLDKGRADVARLWADRLAWEELPKRPRTRKRVDKLTKAQEAMMPEWAKRWIGVGLSTQPADRPLFEAAVTACYRYTGLPAPRVIWCPSPLVVALAGPIAAHILKHRRSGDAVVDAVGGAVRDAVRGAVGDAVVDAVGGAVRDAVRGAVGDAVGGAVGGADPQVLLAPGNEWWRRMCGQFWVGGWWWGSPSFVSFLTEVAGLRLARDIELRAQAYAATCMSACWWWPARGHVFTSERPRVLKVENNRLELAEWDGWRVTR